MSLNADSASVIPSQISDFAYTAWDKVSGLFGHFTREEFSSHSPEQTLAMSPGIDPHFIPRAPMNNANLDVGLLAKLSHEGYKHGKEITAETHPQLYQAWVTMCGRAGLHRVPQLVLGESKSLNAASLNGENAVMVSTELLKKLNLREVVAVLGHELGHESSEHTKPRAMAMSIFGLGGAILGDNLAHRGGIGAYIDFANMKEGYFKKALHWMFHSDKKPLSTLGGLWYIIAGGWLGLGVANQVSVRPTELEADRKGAYISGDPEALISALGKLEDGRKSTLMRWVRKIHSGYPSTEKRMERLHEIATTMPHTVPVAASIAGVMGDVALPSPAMQNPIAGQTGHQCAGAACAQYSAAPSASAQTEAGEGTSSAAAPSMKVSGVSQAESPRVNALLFTAAVV